ncbi:hypothetical protein D3C83_107590 [compost metagenome]
MRIDRADAAEILITLRDLRACLVADAQAAEDVVEKGHDLVRTFGTAEGDDQQGVVAPRLAVVEARVERLRHGAPARQPCR